MATALKKMLTEIYAKLKALQLRIKRSDKILVKGPPWTVSENFLSVFERTQNVFFNASLAHTQWVICV